MSGTFSFRTGCFETQCSKTCYSRFFELVDLSDNEVIEHVYYNIHHKSEFGEFYFAAKLTARTTN